jgi:hypothetical protein
VQIRTDDDVYRVDAVWLGPPRATFPWRARYSSYGVGLIVMIAVMFLQRRLGIPLGFFSVAWALLITVVVVRFVAKRIDEDRPLLEWLTLFAHELRAPRRRTRGEGSTVGTGHIAVEAARPRPALPAGRTDPHGALALPDPAPRRPARRTAPAVDPQARRPRRRSGRSWTTRGGGIAPPPPMPPPPPRTPPPPPPRTPPPPSAPTAATASDGLPEDGDGVLHVTARRADRAAAASRTRRARDRPATGPRRYGPRGATDATAGAAGRAEAREPRSDEEGDGAPQARP